MLGSCPLLGTTQGIWQGNELLLVTWLASLRLTFQHWLPTSDACGCNTMLHLRIMICTLFLSMPNSLCVVDAVAVRGTCKHNSCVGGV
jgi:hypothetical protein